MDSQSVRDQVTAAPLNDRGASVATPEGLLGSDNAAARLSDVCEALFVDAVSQRHPDLGLVLSAMPSAARTPIRAVLERVGDESSLAIAETLNEIVCECRGALEYAAPETPVYRLAARVVSALERVL